MTLCKFRPQRTYDEQFIVDTWDLRGLMKYLDTMIHQLGEDGDALTPYYVGARLILSTLFGGTDKLEIWTQAADEFEKGLEELEGVD